MVKLFNPETKRLEEVDDYHAFDVLGYFPSDDTKIDRRTKMAKHRKCKYGKLKNPKGSRFCKKR